jgi:hypothetical protein
MIIFWKDYRSTACDAVARYVRCEHCSAEFGYVLHRERVGHAISWFCLDDVGAETRSFERAQEWLRRALESDIEPHTCPKCHRLQQAMVREAKKRFLGWMSVGNVIWALVWLPVVFLVSLLVINAFSGPPGPSFYCIWPGILLAIVLLPVLRPVLAAFYDPIRLTPEQMIRKGISEGTPLGEWEAVQEKTEQELRRVGITTFPPRLARPQPEGRPEAVANKSLQM